MDPDLKPDYMTARALAEAMQRGLEQRRTAAPLSVSTIHTLPELQSHADLLRLPPLARPGFFRPLVCLARSGLRALFRPWLAVQTEFNAELVREVARLRESVAALSARLESRVAASAREAGAQESGITSAPCGEAS
jgi:hypothetical protein